MTSLPALTDEQRAELTDSRSPFTAEDRVAIAMVFITSGGSSGIAAHRATAMLGQEVLSGTIRQWRTRPWWKSAEEIAKQALQKELEHKYTRLMHETEKEMLDRVQNGDHRLSKEGEVVRVPATLRDLVGAHAIVSDKRAMIRGEPTSRKEDTGLSLALKLAEMLHAQGKERVKEALPGEFEVIETEIASVKQ